MFFLSVPLWYTALSLQAQIPSFLRPEMQPCHGAPRFFPADQFWPSVLKFKSLQSLFEHQIALTKCHLDNLNANELAIFGLFPVNLPLLSQTKGEAELEQSFVPDSMVSKWKYTRRLFKKLKQTSLGLWQSLTSTETSQRTESNFRNTKVGLQLPFSPVRVS